MAAGAPAEQSPVRNRTCRQREQLQHLDTVFLGSPSSPWRSGEEGQTRDRCPSLLQRPSPKGEALKAKRKTGQIFPFPLSNSVFRRNTNKNEKLQEQFDKHPHTLPPDSKTSCHTRCTLSVPSSSLPALRLLTSIIIS